MERTVTMGGKPVKLRATAALPRVFRATYGTDFFAELKRIKDGADADAGASLELIENLAFVMARSADPDGTPPDIVDWLDGFDDPLAISEIAGDVIDLYKANAKTTAIPKKKKKRRKGK